MIYHEVSGTIPDETGTYVKLEGITRSRLGISILDFLARAERDVGAYGIPFTLDGVVLYFSRHGIIFRYVEAFE